MNSFENYNQKAKIETNNSIVAGRYDSNNEENIWEDILAKVSNLKKENISILDIGCGCSKPVEKLIENSKKYNQKLTLIDGNNILDRIDCSSDIIKIPYRFPVDTKEQLEGKKFDIILAYSVLHYTMIDGILIDFMDSAVELLNKGGELFIGDVPNLSKKKRFLSSDFGKEFQLNYMKNHPKSKMPEINFSTFEKNALDDSIIFYILQRYRNMGFDTYILPQERELPFNHTREDILIKRYL